jgi:hypothetical protein
LIFKTANWSTPQTVTITGVDDSDSDGDVAYTIHTAPATGAAEYTRIDPLDVSVTNLDDELPPVQQVDVQDIWYESRQRGKKNTDFRWFVQILEDTNGNGVADDGDLGIAGVTVTLTFSGQEYTGTTDESGVFQTDWIRNQS